MLESSAARLYVACYRAKEIKHSGPNIGKKVVKKSVVNHSVKSSSPVPSPRPRGRPPKNGYPPKASADVVDSAKRKSDAQSSDSTPLPSPLPADNFQLR